MRNNLHFRLVKNRFLLLLKRKLLLARLTDCSANDSFWTETDQLKRDLSNLTVRNSCACVDFRDVFLSACRRRQTFVPQKGFTLTLSIVTKRFHNHGMDFSGIFYNVKAKFHADSLFLNICQLHRLKNRQRVKHNVTKKREFQERRLLPSQLLAQ